MNNKSNDDFIIFNGKKVIKEWPAIVAKSQLETHVCINGKMYERIKYGLEYGEDAPFYPCHDCAVAIGQYHCPGCNSEICPKCMEQTIPCSCE
jgi:hypothetical protein